MLETFMTYPDVCYLRGVQSPALTRQHVAPETFIRNCFQHNVQGSCLYSQAAHACLMNWSMLTPQMWPIKPGGMSSCIYFRLISLWGYDMGMKGIDCAAQAIEKWHLITADHALDRYLRTLAKFLHALTPWEVSEKTCWNMFSNLSEEYVAYRTACDPVSLPHPSWPNRWYFVDNELYYPALVSVT